jgi:hypothetical protein
VDRLNQVQALPAVKVAPKLNVRCSILYRRQLPSDLIMSFAGAVRASALSHRPTTRHRLIASGHDFLQVGDTKTVMLPHFKVSGMRFDGVFGPLMRLPPIGPPDA